MVLFPVTLSDPFHMTVRVSRGRPICELLYLLKKKLDPRTRVRIYTLCLKKPGTRIMPHNSYNDTNQTLWVISDRVNCAKIINLAEYQLRQLPWQPRHFQQYSAPARCTRVTVEYFFSFFIFFCVLLYDIHFHNNNNNNNIYASYDTPIHIARPLAT